MYNMDLLASTTLLEYAYYSRTWYAYCQCIVLPLEGSSTSSYDSTRVCDNGETSFFNIMHNTREYIRARMLLK